MRNLRYGLFAVTIVVAAAGFAGPVQAQPYGYGPGYGMMGGGYGPGWMMGRGYGPGMMGGYGPGYMMGGGYGPGYMMGPGYGPGMMGGYGPGYMMRGYGGGYGPGMMGGYGYHGYHGNQGYQGNLNLSTDQVKKYLEQTLRNPNLKVGEVKEKDADTIVADIVTKDKDALVQRLDFNRHNGFIQPEQ
jgi:hypothetical protein